MKQRLFTLVCALMMAGGYVSAQQAFVPNYDETKVPQYTLPEPMVFENGRRVNDAEAMEKRQQEMRDLFAHEVYGISPEWNGGVHAEVVSENKEALDGFAIMKEVKLTLRHDNRKLEMMVLLYLPKKETPVPLFLGYNFSGNQATTTDSMVQITDSWVANNEQLGIADNKSTEATRGTTQSRWPYKEIITRGYGVATIYYGDVDPDFDDGFQNGVHQLMGTEPDSTSWGSVAAWAWGLSRAMDYLETLDEIDYRRVIAIGHSRLGKAALWAGATDERFAMVVSNESGCGGAAISRRQYGETVERINNNFPHWFAANFKKYNRNEASLPVDQHQLLALIAPRPLYVSSAEEDLWADPRGEFLATVAATPVWQLYGLEGMPVTEMPAPNQPVIHGKIGYHIRPGKHDITLYDWQQFISFADRHLKSR